MPFIVGACLWACNFFGGRDMKDKHDMISNITDNIRRVFQILNKQSQRIKHKTSLTGPQLWAIGVIHEHGPINISSIAKRMHLHPTTILRIIDRLESRGLISRNRSKDDRRVIWVELTQDGKSLIQWVPEVTQGLLGGKLEQIKLDNLAEIDAGLTQLVKIFDVEDMFTSTSSLERNMERREGVK
jgi:MarR family transcriptional regulator, organic hydroperoxide resistance regulator